MIEAPVSVKKSVEYLVATVRIPPGFSTLGRLSLIDELQIDGATRDKTSGHFSSIEGKDWAW